jgi:S-adenosylmethionine-diacylgycerolhomoserine-N-methlytransferase
VSGLAAEARTLFAMLRGQAQSGTHAERLQSFYAPQAEHYDRFRERLLHGRDELLLRLPLRRGDRLVELGGGTGRNVAALGSLVSQLARVEIVDLCPALLARARERFLDSPNVRVVEADITTYQPAAAADVVLMSYVLTMVPDWRAAIDNAVSMLKPGGTLAVVDFCPGSRESAWMSGFWRRWFAHDGVHLSREHVETLQSRLPDHEFSEHAAAVPYLPALKVTYYRFVGHA